jgi:hypothetical protein
MNFLKPLVTGDDLPDFWFRVDGEDRYFFFAHPGARGLTYPMAYGKFPAAEAARREVRINIGGQSIAVKLDFKPYQSLLIQCRPHGKEFIDLGFPIPQT